MSFISCEKYSTCLECTETYYTRFLTIDTPYYDTTYYEYHDEPMCAYTVSWITRDTKGKDLPFFGSLWVQKCCIPVD